MSDNFSILIFTWNAGGLRLCETTSQAKANSDRSGFFQSIFTKPCTAPDFFETVRSIIVTKKPSLVLITTQDEDNSNTYFHSDLLPNVIIPLNYSLLKRNKLESTGENKSVFKDVPNVNSSGTAMRVSIFINNSEIDNMTLDEPLLHKKFGTNGQLYTVQNNNNRMLGANASYVNHKKYGKFVFITVHLPGSLDSLNVNIPRDFEFYRATMQASSTLFILSAMSKFVYDIEDSLRPQHVFLIGDMNYDIVIPNKTPYDMVKDLVSSPITLDRLKNLQKYDELLSSRNVLPFRGFKEGVNDMGPLFLPDWRLTRGRNAANCNIDLNAVPPKNTVGMECYDTSNGNLSSLGWHNRILYIDVQGSAWGFTTYCSMYERLDKDNITASSNAAIWGMFNMIGYDPGPLPAGLQLR